MRSGLSGSVQPPYQKALTPKSIRGCTMASLERHQGAPSPPSSPRLEGMAKGEREGLFSAPEEAEDPGLSAGRLEAGCVSPAQAGRREASRRRTEGDGERRGAGRPKRRRSDSFQGQQVSLLRPSLAEQQFGYLPSTWTLHLLPSRWRDAHAALVASARPLLPPSVIFLVFPTVTFSPAPAAIDFLNGFSCVIN